MAYSILIKNGIVIDGTGTPPKKADVGISGNYIKDIGDLSGSSADKVIDASGKFVTPGFVDLTNHSDTYATIFSNPSQDSMIRQGVTTSLFGNCGESLAPIVKKETLLALNKWVTASEINLDWNSMSEYYKALADLRPGVNIATLVGHETLRRNVASPDEMVLLLESAMVQGAWGLSSNFSFSNWGDALPETTTLLKLVKRFNGLYKIHLRDEGKNFLPSVASLIDIARITGVRTVISHIKAIGKSSWGDFVKALRMIGLAKESDMEIYFDFFPYMRTGSMLINLLPSWAREGGDNLILKRISDPSDAARIINELKAITLHADRIFIASAKTDKKIVGKTLAEISLKVSMSPEEVILEILKINSLNVTFFGKTIVGKNLILASYHKDSVLASDGAGYDLNFQNAGNLVHPRSFGAYPRFFSVLAPKAKLKPEEAILKMTSLPAKILGLNDRGKLSKNFLADIAVFDELSFRDKATYKDPYRFPEGMKCVIVNGSVAYEEGSEQIERKGIILKKNINA